MNREQLLKRSITSYINEYGLSNIRNMYQDYCDKNYLPAEYTEFKSIVTFQTTDTIDEFVTDINNIKGRVSRKIYQDYVEFCKENRYFPLGYIIFRKQLMSKYDLKSKQIRLNNRRVYILY